MTFKLTYGIASSIGVPTARDEEMRDAAPLEQRDGQGDAEAQPASAPKRPAAQQRSRVVKPGERRSKKGKKRMHTGDPPSLAATDYVKVVAVSKRSEVQHLSPRRGLSAYATLRLHMQFPLDIAQMSWRFTLYSCRTSSQIHYRPTAQLDSCCADRPTD